MENLVFIFKEKKSVAFIISSSLILLFGILWIQNFLFGGIVVSIGSIILIVQNKGIEIDLKKLKYRNARFIGDVSIGNWKDLPEIKYISVFRTVLVSAVVGRSGARVSNREKVILINFIHGKNQRLRVYKTEDKKDAFEKAEYLANILKLRIYDATEKKGEWYK